jgi:hypothetical protein
MIRPKAPLSVGSVAAEKDMHAHYTAYHLNAAGFFSAKGILQQQRAGFNLSLQGAERLLK